MSYFVRAFCTDSMVPELNKVIQWLQQKGYNISLDQQVVQTDACSPDWNQAAVVYKQGKMPIIVECNKDTGSEDCLMKEEIDEFLEFVGSPGLSLQKRAVVKHLKKTKYIIACRLPTTDIDDDGYKINNIFLDYFVEHHGGLIQADAEGFYKGNNLIVKCD